jgi:hypothetical protein
MAAGPRIATNRDGKMKRINGNNIFEGIFAANSSALMYLLDRKVRIEAYPERAS